MKKHFLISILFFLCIAARAQIIIPFGPPPSATEPTEKERGDLIKKSYVLNFLHFRGDSIKDTFLLQLIIGLHSDNDNYCILYKDDTTKIAVAITRLKSQGGFMITTFRARGNIRRISRYDENLLPTGKWVVYYANKSVKAEGEYKKGKKIGKWKYYDDSGRKTLTENHLEDGAVIDTHANLKD
jgi:antitoxin component YwqK of YwqJK toxin-antitoxin module